MRARREPDEAAIGLYDKALHAAALQPQTADAFER